MPLSKFEDPTDFPPVSYTHLDVYKRQVPSSFKISTRAPPGFKPAILVISSVASVSYTHLDIDR